MESVNGENKKTANTALQSLNLSHPEIWHNPPSALISSVSLQHLSPSSQFCTSASGEIGENEVHNDKEGDIVINEPIFPQNLLAILVVYSLSIYANRWCLNKV